MAEEPAMYIKIFSNDVSVESDEEDQLAHLILDKKVEESKPKSPAEYKAIMSVATKRILKLNNRLGVLKCRYKHYMGEAQKQKEAFEFVKRELNDLRAKRDKIEKLCGDL